MRHKGGQRSFAASRPNGSFAQIVTFAKLRERLIAVIRTWSG